MSFKHLALTNIWKARGGEGKSNPVSTLWRFNTNTECCKESQICTSLAKAGQIRLWMSQVWVKVCTSSTWLTFFFQLGRNVSWQTQTQSLVTSEIKIAYKQQSIPHTTADWIDKWKFLAAHLATIFMCFVKWRQAEAKKVILFQSFGLEQEEGWKFSILESSCCQSYYFIVSWQDF